MADIIQLKEGRYKGIDILFVDADTTGGNRIIKFNYPNSDNQSIERQGKLPRTYTLTIWIPHENYYQNRDSLLRILEDGEKGVFTHPTFGDINNVINGQYTLTERLSELGRASITVVFEIDDGDGIPVQAGNLASQVRVASDELNTSLLGDLANIFKVTLSNTGNYADAIAIIDNVASSFTTAFSVISASEDSGFAAATAIKGFLRDAGDSIAVPVNLANRLSDLFAITDNLSDDPTEVVSTLRSLFNFGSTDPVIKQSTVARIERKNNRDAIRAAVRTQALSLAYVNYALVTYNTTVDLDVAQRNLEDQYKSIITDENISNASLELLDRLRVQGQKTLDTVRVSTQSITTIETTLTPLAVLVYAYYGSLDLIDTIAELNNVQQSGFVEGQLRILVND